MKKHEAEKRIDPLLEEAMKNYAMATPAINFADRTMYKLRDVAMITSNAAYALGKGFYRTIWVLFLSLLSLIIVPSFTNVEVTQEVQYWHRVVEQLPAPLQEFTISTEVAWLFLGVALLVLFIVFLDFFMPKQFARIRS